MNISLPPELDRLVAETLRKEPDLTASELVSQALWMLFIERESRERLKARLNAELQVAIDELDRGEGLDAEAVFEELRQHIASKRGAA